MSDIVALMVLEHQVTAHNALVEGNLVARQTLHRHRRMKEAFGESPDSPLSDTNRRILESQADRILRALLFADEHLMSGDGVEGSIAFQKAFSATAKKSSDHRSLKDLRLYERLFKYRCSYLIYSEAFDHLPPVLKGLVLEKLKRGLGGSTDEPACAHLGESEKQHILRILEDTLPGW